MKGSAYDLALLFAREFMEIDCIARNADREIRICLGIFVSLHESFAVEDVYVDMVRHFSEISVKDRNEV